MKANVPELFIVISGTMSRKGILFNIEVRATDGKILV